VGSKLTINFRVGSVAFPADNCFPGRIWGALLLYLLNSDVSEARVPKVAPTRFGRRNWLTFPLYRRFLHGGASPKRPPCLLSVAGAREIWRGRFWRLRAEWRRGRQTSHRNIHAALF